MNREQLVRSIQEDLAYLSDASLKQLQEVAAQLRRQTTDEQQKPPEPPTFIDEIERVKQQSPPLPGHHDDASFA